MAGEKKGYSNHNLCEQERESFENQVLYDGEVERTWSRQCDHVIAWLLTYLQAAPDITIAVCRGCQEMDAPNMPRNWSRDRWSVDPGMVITCIASAVISFDEARPSELAML